MFSNSRRSRILVLLILIPVPHSSLVGDILECSWPPAAAIDDSVDLRHQVYSFRDGRYDAAIVQDFALVQRSTKFVNAAVLQPLLTDLVATDIEGPDVRRHFLKPS